MTGAALIDRLLEGESAKKALSASKATRAEKLKLISPFVKSYVATMLWSSTLPAFDDCPGCGQRRVLDRWDGELEEQVCANCSEVQDDGGDPAETNYSWEAFSVRAKDTVIADCTRFVDAHYDDIKNNLDLAGHDFWLTRAMHGAGYWEGIGLRAWAGV